MADSLLARLLGIAIALLAAVAVLWSEPVLACSVCAGKGFPQRVLDAYLGITILLTVLPFAILGVILAVLRRGQSRSKQVVKIN